MLFSDQMTNSNCPPVDAPSAPAPECQQKTANILRFEEVDRTCVGIVGGKNASLGEMTRSLKDRGIGVPEGFALTANAYRGYLAHNRLDPVIEDAYERLAAGKTTLPEVTSSLREAFLVADFPPEMKAEILDAYHALSDHYGQCATDVAVRSSATAEDLPDASFAGQQETFLHVQGNADLLETCQRCFASLFTERAISYREQKGFEHLSVALSVGVQKMVRSDTGASGVIFTLDTETGFPEVVVISAAYGLGETVVQGVVNPDEYRVFKPALSDLSKRPVLSRMLGEKELKMIYDDSVGSRVQTIPTTEDERDRFVLDEEQILLLARWSVEIEEHYGCPMDIEWALDGQIGKLYIVQARPETVQSRRSVASLHSSRLKTPPDSSLILTEGQSVGCSIGSGTTVVLSSIADAADFREGQILVAEQTDPDWVPLMQLAGGIITDHGGRTSHAAIVSRELGIPAIIGTGDATRLLDDGQEVTLDCSGGTTGRVYQGLLEHVAEDIDLDDQPSTQTAIMMNIASPDTALRWWQLPTDGIGLARLEFVINNVVRAHPMALVKAGELGDPEVESEIQKLSRHFASPADYFVQTLAVGMAQIAASVYPRPVIVRTSDFKTNEYAELLGGHLFEPKESNPMIGFRGAARYTSPLYRPAFELECQAIRRAREVLGLDNITVMIPFCRTLEEADLVLEIMAAEGLERGADGLQVYVMAEIPSNIILAREFALRFDGFSIGSNDLTQLTLGIDRDSELLAADFDERDLAVTRSISQLIRVAHEEGCKVGICGQGPSDKADFAEFLVGEGIDSLSLTPDRIVATRQLVADLESSASEKS